MGETVRREHTDNRQVPPPPRQQREQPVACGPETGAISRTSSQQGPPPPARHILPIVDTGPNQVGPFVSFSPVPPGPIDGRLIVVARNPGDIGRPERFIYQELFLPNPAAPGWVAYTGADTFATGSIQNNLRPIDDHAEVRRPVNGPPSLKPFVRDAEPAARDREAPPDDGGHEFEAPAGPQVVQQVAPDDGGPVDSDATSHAPERHEDHEDH